MIKSFCAIFRLSVNFVEPCLLEQPSNPVASANLLLNYLGFQGLGQRIFRSSTNCHPFGFTILSQTFKSYGFLYFFYSKWLFLDTTVSLEGSRNCLNNSKTAFLLPSKDGEVRACRKNGLTERFSPNGGMNVWETFK